MKGPDLSFNKFLSAFPEQELPVSLTEETIIEFERNNDPLPIELVDLFVESQDGESFDLVDYVPCLKIPETHDFHAVVLWRGDVLRHEYVLITFDKDGNLLANGVIAGMKVEGNMVLRSVATIEPNWIIHIAEGAQEASETHYSPTSTRTYQMELLSTGELIFLVGSEE